MPSTYCKDLEQTIVEASNVLCEVCHDDHEHIIECHADDLPERYRALAQAAEKALQLLQVHVHAIAERQPGGLG